MAYEASLCHDSTSHQARSQCVTVTRGVNLHGSNMLLQCTAALQAEHKMEQKRRGKADTQTSDARFDEQFQLGHRMETKVAPLSLVSRVCARLCHVCSCQQHLLPKQWLHCQGIRVHGSAEVSFISASRTNLCYAA